MANVNVPQNQRRKRLRRRRKDIERQVADMKAAGVVDVAKIAHEMRRELERAR